jgi:hypothetical protein
MPVLRRWGRRDVEDVALIPDDDDGPCPCPLCREDVPDEIVAMIMESAAQKGTTMTKEEFLDWLDRVGREP